MTDDTICVSPCDICGEDFESDAINIDCIVCGMCEDDGE